MLLEETDLIYQKGNQSQQKKEWKQIYKNLISCSFQTALGYICLDIMFAISLHYVALKSETAASGIGFAYVVFSIIVQPIGSGLNQSLNVHVAQAIGANQISLTRTFLTMTIHMHFMYIIPLFSLVYFMKIPFSYTFPEENRDLIVGFAWEYMPLLMLSYLFSIELECFKAYLLAYEVTTIFIFIHFITTGFHIFWCWLLIDKYDLGVKGAGLSLTITEITNLSLLYLCIVFSKHKQLFQGAKWTTSYKWVLLISYFKSSYSIILHIFSEYLNFFVLTFIGMQLGADMFYAQVAFSNTCSFYFRIPIGLSLGLLTFTGQEMGRLDQKKAQLYTYAGAVIFLCVAFILILCLWFLRIQWTNFYAPNSAVIREVLEETLPFFILSCLFMDGLQGAMSGALKGIEKKNLVSYSSLIVYYCFGVPLDLILTFSWGLNFKLIGIWIGFGITNLILCIIYISALFRVDWKKQASIIHKRLMQQTQLNNYNNISLE